MLVLTLVLSKVIGGGDSLTQIDTFWLGRDSKLRLCEPETVHELRLSICRLGWDEDHRLYYITCSVRDE